MANAKRKSGIVPYEEKNSNFLQVQKDALDDEDWLMERSKSAVRLLHFIWKNMDKYNALCVSINAMCELLGLSRSTVTRSIKLLKESGFISVRRVGGAYVYSANDSQVFGSSQRNRKYCKFVNAAIILTASENKAANDMLTDKKVKQFTPTIDAVELAKKAERRKRVQNEEYREAFVNNCEFGQERTMDEEGMVSDAIPQNSPSMQHNNV